MKLEDYIKTSKRISMNRLLLAEDSKKNRIIYNYNDFVGPKVEAYYDDKGVLEGDSDNTYVYPSKLTSNYYTRGAEELNNYRNDKAKLLVGRKLLLKDKIYNSGRVVKVKNCVYRNDGIDLDYYFWETDFIYLNEFVTEFAPKKKELEKKEKEMDTNINHAILIPCTCILIIFLTIILGFLTTIWGTARFLNPMFFICSVVANFIVLIIEIRCLEQLDKSLEIK